jgi:hypothetical protein
MILVDLVAIQTSKRVRFLLFSLAQRHTSKVPLEMLQYDISYFAKRYPSKSLSSSFPHTFLSPSS